MDFNIIVWSIAIFIISIYTSFYVILGVIIGLFFCIYLIRYRDNFRHIILKDYNEDIKKWQKKIK